MEHGWIGRLTFKKVGLLLLLATLLLGILWGVMEVYARRAEAEYEAVSAAYFQGQVEFERFRETRKNYERVQYGGGKYSFSWYQHRVETAFVASGIGLFLWLLTLTGKGILWLLGERNGST